MSSAALQSAPHQPTTVGSHSPIAAPSSARASQSRDPYYNQQPANTSPTSNRRPSKRPSGNGASASTNPQQPQYYSPPPVADVRDPSFASTSPTDYSGMAPGDHQRGVPPVVSPRTSSNRNASHGTTTSDRSERSRRAGYTAEQTNQARGTSDSQQDRGDRQSRNGNTQVNGAERSGDDAAAAARARRRAAQSPDAVPHRPSGSRDPRPTNPAGVAQNRQTMPSPAGPSREPSEILNRIVVSPPEVDLDRERERMADGPVSATSHTSPIGVLNPVGPDGNVEPSQETGRSGSRSRHDHSTSSGKREKNSRFGEYYLGNTLGEGEFGKVKMGWKQDDGIQVAIKLIQKDSIGNSTTRLAKIYREIAILREISHPNIVKLHEMAETPKQIGIVLEYASGGELFDYILNHRYLKDHAARRLFAQLISGVGYLHKKGIVHRDLKLENLLLDRNRNIIITDFGFANTFDPEDELGDDIEYNLSSRDYVKRMELDKILPSGSRRGDLMQTSCGSPCYAAPELVVSDSLYTGRKVDVWSCGVILYAMLAGYLPFDDDPANPEGDNINLLYKYIVSTPLTFPEYVTPHARDLLRRILVPDPRKRADLFEVARHSWLSEFQDKLGFITSSTSTHGDIQNTTIGQQEDREAPLLARSASVREPSKTAKTPTAVGDLARKHGNVDVEAPEPNPKSKDNKRRTVQVEYVPPKSQTVRGEPSSAPAQKTRARAGSQGPVEVLPQQQARRAVSTEKPLPRDPPGAQYGRPSSSQRPQNMPPPTRREVPRSASEANQVSGAPPVSMGGRPNTGGSMSSRSGALPNRGSYSQPAPATVAGTNAQGRIAQPTNQTNYSNISAPIMQDQPEYPQITANPIPAKFAKVAGLPHEASASESKGHKRSSTIGGFFSRTNSVFGGKRDKEPLEKPEKPKKSYPPVSMTSAIGTGAGADTPRQSMDSRRSISFGFNKKRSGSITGGSQTTLQEKPRRFSLLPASFSLKAIGIGKEYGTPGAPPSGYDSRPDSQSNFDLPNPQHPQPHPRNASGSTTSGHNQYTNDGVYDRGQDSPVTDRRGTSTASPPQVHRYASNNIADPRSGAPPQFLPQIRPDPSAMTTESESSLNELTNRRGGYPPGFNPSDDRRPPQVGRQNSGGRGVLQKNPNSRKFADAYEHDQGNGFGPTHNDHAGSSGAARKVMDFFRRRGKDRST